MNERLPVCRSLADCETRDGQRIAVEGLYRHDPDLPGIDYPAAPRAVRLELADGPGPFLEPFWSPRAIRAPAEIAQFLGKRVRVQGLYHRLMPRNPDDPPQASAMGGACIEVEAIMEALGAAPGA